MVVKIIADKDQLESIGIDPEWEGFRGVKTKEYWTGYDAVFVQWFCEGHYMSYEFDIPNYWLEPVN